MEIELSVHGLMPDPQTDHQILILKPKNDPDGKFLPIWIGIPEADAIKLALDKSHSQRPLTHDLAKTMLDYFNISLTRVLIYKMVQGTFFAHLVLNDRASERLVDSRPSDAIALAIRMKAPVFIEEEVYLKQQARLNENQEIENIDLES